ncbi:MAG: hypothetical protein ABL931_17530 [Usitatibacteraceae bacterium]
MKLNNINSSQLMQHKRIAVFTSYATQKGPSKDGPVLFRNKTLRHIARNDRRL